MLKQRLALGFIIYFLAFIAFPNVWDTVSYMYPLNINTSYLKGGIGFLFIVVLILATNFKIVMYRHAFDIFIIGILTPVTVMTSFLEDFGIQASFYIFLTLLIASFSVKIFHSTFFFSSLRKQSAVGLSYVEFSSIIYILFTLSFVYFALRFYGDFTLDLWSVFLRTYEIRAEKQVLGLPGYLLGWFSGIFFPVLLANGIVNRNKVLLISSFFSAFFLFQVLAVKVIFLNYILLFTFGFAYYYYYRVARYTPFFFYIFLLFSALIFEDDSYRMMIDRFFYLIGTNTILYFDYYSTHPLRFFAGTKLDIGLVEYLMEPGIQIDMVYYQGYGTNQSAGYMANMYANLGIFGLLFSGILIGPTMIMIHSISKNSDMLAYLFLVSLATSLINTSFTMLFLSNGLIFILLASIFLKKEYP